MDELHIQDSSNCCRHKLKQTISRNFYSHFWRVFDIWPICAAASIASGSIQMPPSPLSQRRLQQMAAEQQQRQFNDSRSLMIHEEEEEPLIPPR